jgi:hypothetical protein
MSIRNFIAILTGVFLGSVACTAMRSVAWLIALFYCSILFPFIVSLIAKKRRFWLGLIPNVCVALWFIGLFITFPSSEYDDWVGIFIILIMSLFIGLIVCLTTYLIKRSLIFLIRKFT